MNPIRSLVGQTAIYGISSIVGRLLNFFLVPLYALQFTTAEYGQVTDLYTLTVFLLVVLTYGMETTLFRFLEKSDDKTAVGSTAFTSLLVSAVLFLSVVWLWKTPIANALRYPDHAEYIVWFALILALDAITAIPFAWLRAKERAARFAFVRLTNIGVNIGLNLFFILLCPWLAESGMGESWLRVVYNPAIGVGYIFISNLVASAVSLLLLLPEIKKFKVSINPMLWRSMMVYALPLLFAGFAGAINEAADRQLLKYLLPEDEAFSQLGVYGACYKLSIFMTLFIQAFRYGAEPFFFSYFKNENARQVYARIMDYFLLAMCVIFVGLNVFLEPIARVFLPNPAYREGLFVVPILLLANLFLGLYLYLSVWYKLSDQTKYGAYISLFGAFLTIVLNLWWIPLWGYAGAAWATLAAYGAMMIISYFLGQRKFPIPYKLQKNMLLLAVSIAIVVISRFLWPGNMLLSAFVLAIFAAFVFWLEKPLFLALMKRK
jgi:O-antigen/teichoic acid export membrane protein